VGIFDLVSKGVGKVLIGGAKIGLGMVQGAGEAGFGIAKLTGGALLKSAPVVGKGVWGVSKGVGNVLTAPFATAENRARTAGNYLDLIKSMGNAIVHKNKEGNIRLTKVGLGIVGGVAMATKANDSYFEAKARNLGAVDQKPVTATPNYNPVQYEMSPRKRITADSGGATGDLVFALHKLR